ncbi:Sensor histidine kinase RcsC [Brevundimonas sp. NIBR10]|uniref:ATP-binding protein n=1 Tax=Brevundimonas sp. NIBR10 TaxID=3015997 RepID=UPI0022F17CCB|nr:ATP-binding protein [Brevundimonas sp. NIBR10]WGM46698.1 Sensor histidine kinase RcsC [Brevundimonas sp. NIBR10]
MPRFSLVLVALLLGVLIGGPVWASAPQRSPRELAAAVERRAGATDFAQLVAFGDAAMTRDDREGLNRLYHVAWIFLNQGDFDNAILWNRRLEAAARRLDDGRYVMIAHLNNLAIRYDQGDATAAGQMAVLATSERDWFTRAHATRLHALSLIDEDRIGEALKMLGDVDTLIPEGDRYAATAHAGVWEMVGMGLMDLNDFDGAATAFGRFEIDFADPAYPRPDFDSLYNLAKLAAQLGDADLAHQFYASHHRLSERASLASLSTYDANLCAMVAQAGDDARGVLDCLEPYGHDLGDAAFLAGSLLPMRAIAYARTGQVGEAQADLNEIRRREASGAFREDGASKLPLVEAEILFARGQSAEAYRILRAYDRADAERIAQRFSAGIRQVTGDMQEKLDERRAQLETVRANATLQRDVIRSQNWMFGIGIVFFLFVSGAMVWQFRLSGHLRAARRRADLANRSKSEFLANMSHEIRTPLNGIVAMADTLTRSVLPPREQEMVGVIRSSGITLERLLSDILDTARIESGQVTIEPIAFHLGEAVRSIGMLWGPKATEKGVDLSINLDPTLDIAVIGDPVRFRQILTNLTSNALKFTDAGSVRIEGAPTGDGRMRFTVTDTGVGFDDAQKARIFTRFQQADGSITRRFGGTGLGLAISRDLAELMGGSMDCRSRPGEGASFWFDLPLDPAPEMALAEEADAAETDARGLRVLLADDHPANRKVVEIMLGDSGVELTMVEDGQQALDRFTSEPFDLVLMDMQMPVMDGLTATRAIRTLEAGTGRARTPIVMLTANALAEHVAAGKEAGADGHLAKPITLATLFAAIEAAMGAGEDGAETHPHSQAA